MWDGIGKTLHTIKSHIGWYYPIYRQIKKKIEDMAKKISIILVIIAYISLIVRGFMYGISEGLVRLGISLSCFAIIPFFFLLKDDDDYNVKTK